MATISKFYLHDATSPNTGTLPTNSPAASAGTVTGDATGATTNRDATDVIGAGQTSSLVTANANQNLQRWGHRRFLSRAMAAQNLPSGTWTFSYARDESNLNHNQKIVCRVRVLNPADGSFRGSPNNLDLIGTEPTVAATEQAEAPTSSAGLSGLAIFDGDFMCFEVFTEFTQSHSSAYTENFYYDGATEASTTDCASFVTPPAALTLFTAAAVVIPTPLFALTRT